MSLGYLENKEFKEKVNNCYIEMIKHLNYIRANKCLKGIKKKFSSEQFMCVVKNGFNI